MRGRRIGRLIVSTSREYEPCELGPKPLTLLVLIAHYAVGAIAGRADGAPYLDIYLGFVSIEFFWAPDGYDEAD